MYKKIVDGKKAAFFDLDGTIVETEIYWQQAFEKTLKPLNLDWFDHDELPAGLTVEDKFKYILDHYKDYLESKPNIEELVKSTYNNFLEIIRNVELDVKLGFWEVAYELKELKGFKLALVTNTPKNITDVVMEKLGIHLTFDLVLSGDQVKRAKPFPDLYLKAAEELKLKPHEIIVFEDSIIGADAAYSAKMDMVIIWNGEPNHIQYPPTVMYFLPDFEGLAGNLDRNYDESLKHFAEEILQEKQENSKEQTQEEAISVA